MHVKLHDVAHIYDLISLLSLALKGHTYAGDKDGVASKLSGRKTVHFPLIGKRCRLYEYRPEAKARVVDTACTVTAAGQAKPPTAPTDINTFNCTYGHTHEVLLKKTAEQQRVNLSAKLHECRGCSMATGLRKLIFRSTHTRADKKLQRVFVDPNGRIIVRSIGGKCYTPIVQDDCTRFTRVFFLGKTSDAARAFESFLAEVRADRTPSADMAARSDNGTRF